MNELSVRKSIVSLILIVACGYSISARAVGFSIGLSGGNIYTGDFPVGDPSREPASFDNPGEESFNRTPDSDYFEACGPDGYQCNFLHKQGKAEIKAETKDGIVRDSKHFQSRLQKALDELDADLLGVQQGQAAMTPYLKKKFENLAATAGRNNSYVDSQEGKYELRKAELTKAANDKADSYLNLAKKLGYLPRGAWADSSDNSNLQRYAANRNISLGDSVPSYEAVTAQQFKLSKALRNSGYTFRATRVLKRLRIREIYRIGSGVELEKLQGLSLTETAGEYFGFDATADDFYGYEMINVANTLSSFPQLQQNPELGMLSFLRLREAQNAVKNSNEGDFLTAVGGAWAVVDYFKGFGLGIADSAIGSISGTIEIVMHPIDSGTNIVNAIMNYDQVWDAVSNQIGDVFENYDSYSTEEKARLHGRIAADIGSMFLGVGALKKASDLARANKYLAKAADRLVSVFDSAKRLEIDSSDLQKILGVKGQTPKFPDSNFNAPTTNLNRHGKLTNGKYTISPAKQAPHTVGSFDASTHSGVSLPSGKSQFLFKTDASRLTLDAAAYADKAKIWVGNKAKVTFDIPVGVHHGTGKVTNTINVYRKASGTVHGAPGSS